MICLIPLTLLLRKAKERYQLGGDPGSLRHLLFMDDLKLYGKDERQLDSLVDTVRVFSTNIGMEFGLKKVWSSGDVYEARVGCEICRDRSSRWRKNENCFGVWL